MNEPEKQQEGVPAATDLVLPDGENSFEIKFDLVAFFNILLNAKDIKL